MTSMTIAASSPRFHWSDYLRALRERYPELILGSALERLDDRLHIGIIQTWVHNEAVVGSDPPDRFEPSAQLGRLACGRLAFARQPRKADERRSCKREQRDESDPRRNQPRIIHCRRV